MNVRRQVLGLAELNPVLPVAYFPIAASPIRSVATARHPTADNHGVAKYDTDPAQVVFGSYDGTTTMIDLRDLETAVEVNRQRRRFSL